MLLRFSFAERLFDGSQAKLLCGKTDFLTAGPLQPAVATDIKTGRCKRLAAARWVSDLI